ncbi:hypothetical protein IMSHALPRED_005865 [Imshaugia aleurites]|uniref:Uncharacterized protein n=1 Tax=Imshaugia aleurites TaxID=172621 RepID=A0A8H3IRB7_9LECA|nr:hypothetical protein IMSHALPRED_005865 [Imshaugia aleurites]
MFSLHVSVLHLSAFLASTASAAVEANGDNTVNLRIETNLSTLYEGPITSGPRNITMGGVTYPCDGQGAGSNPGKALGNCPTDALDAAAKARGFTYDGEFDGEFNDWDVTRIATTEDWYNLTIIQYWGSLVNYQVSTFGERLTLSGCQQLLNPGDDVLWAFITLPAVGGDTNEATGVSFLKLIPMSVTVKKGKGFTVTVTDGRSGNATQNASVAEVKTNAEGKATLYLFDAGFFQYKAHRTGDVRSNVMNVTVTD